MKIEIGLFDRMVLQRNGKNVSETNFSGACSATGPVLATVRRGKTALPGFTSVEVGKAARGQMKGTLHGIPVGGPYEIELRAGNEMLCVTDVLVGDVWLLGGQSNMQGYGTMPKEKLPDNPWVRAFYMNDRWGVAKDPIHNMWECVDEAHITLCGGFHPPKAPKGFGVCPGPAFGISMHRRTGVPQGLIACAHGGTNMEQWDPSHGNDGGKSLYGAMVRRLKKNGGRVAGLLWYQGCSDANAKAAPLYTNRMKAFAAAIRRDSGNPTLPFALVQIGRVTDFDPSMEAPWNSIQDQQRRLPATIRNLTVVPVVDLPLDDNIHIGGEAQTVLGVRLAQAVQVLRGDRKAGAPPIALKSISLDEERNMGVINLEFDNVMGSLCSGSLPVGFTIVKKPYPIQPVRTRLNGNRVQLLVGQTKSDLEQYTLHYGYGFNPICNIQDEEGRSLPVMGPIPLHPPKAVTPYLQRMSVSDPVPFQGSTKALAYPNSLRSLRLKPRTFATYFCDVHEELAKWQGKDAMVYFAVRFACREAMALSASLGYDGPIKAWLDGKQIAHDPNGLNPARPGKTVSKFSASKGNHELLIALDARKGRAWGIFVRFQRHDVPMRLLKLGPGHYAMPQFKA